MTNKERSYQLIDNANYALDGLVKLLTGGHQHVYVEPRSFAALLDMIRDQISGIIIDETGTVEIGRDAVKPVDHAPKSIIEIKDEFIRAADMDNETVVDDVSFALNALEVIFSDQEKDKQISAVEVSSLIRVVRLRLEKFVVGKNLSEVLASA